MATPYEARKAKQAKASAHHQGLTRYPDKSWGVDFYDGTRRIRKKIGSLADAKAYYDECKRFKRIGLVVPESQPASETKVKDLIDLYLKRAENKDSIRDAKVWREWLGEYRPAQVTVDVLRTWCRQQREHLAEASIYRKLAPLSAAFQAGIKAGLVPSNPCADRKELGLKRLKNRRYRTLSPQEELRLLEVLGDRWWPYLQFAILTGMRWSDQFGLRWRDVHLDQRLIVLPDVKGGKQLPLPLSDAAVGCLEEMRRRWPESQFCFCSPTGVRMGQSNWAQRYWRPALELAGIEGFWWHDLRRTMASRLISQGHSLHTVKEALGHQDSRTTEQHYARLANEALRAAMADIARTMAVRPNQPT